MSKPETNVLHITTQRADTVSNRSVPTNVNVFQGVPHGFRRFGEKLSASKHYDQVIEEGIRWAWSKPSGSDGFVIKEH